MNIDNVVKAISIINDHEDQADFDGVKGERLIKLAEETLNLYFPEDYRFFLKELGCGDIAGLEFYGVIKDDFVNSSVPDAVWLTLKERQESNLPENYLIISDTGDGDYILLNCQNGGGKNILLWTPGLKDQKAAFRPYYDNFGDFFYDQIITVLN